MSRAVMKKGSTVRLAGISARLFQGSLVALAPGALGALVLIPAGPALARPLDGLRGERPPRLEDFWRPDRAARERDRQLREALGLLRASLHPLSSRILVTRPDGLRRARSALGRLALAHPTDATIWYWRGHAAQIARDDRETLDAWQKVWALDPDHWSSADTAFSVGLILAKAGRYRESLAIYRRGMPRAVQLSTRGIMASNAAESAMALDDLGLAERLYRESLILRPMDNNAAWWGLMVVLDRRGSTFASEQAAREALVLDPGLRGLVGPDVFFVPDGDVHYYLGLAHEVAGRSREALVEWERFLARLPRSPHAQRAREHLQAAKAQVARYRPRAWLERVVPHSAASEAASLLPVVERCYVQRSRRPGLPEGTLPVALLLRTGRVHDMDPDRSWAPRMIHDEELGRCVRQGLRGRRLALPGLARVFVTFRLERAP